MSEGKIENADGETKFCFKDKEKAEESLKLLESQSDDVNFRKGTVRRLLGRAKRTLSVTKAAEKLKNISEAIGVFEQWLEENGGATAKTSAKPDDDKADKVPGLGYKDKEAAENTLKALEGRDPSYQKLAVAGLVRSSKLSLLNTKNETKIQSIKEAVQILDDFLDKFDQENRGLLNRAYVAYTIIETLPKPTDELTAEFLEAYAAANGNYKCLRTKYPKNDDSTSWDIIRNRQLDVMSAELCKENLKLFTASGEPTEFHMKMVHWAYTPQMNKLKEHVSKLGSESRKRKSSADSGHSDEERKKKKH